MNWAGHPQPNSRVLPSVGVTAARQKHQRTQEGTRSPHRKKPNQHSKTIMPLQHMAKLTK